MVIRLCAEQRAPSYPSTAFSRDREEVRLRLLELLIVVGKADLNAARKVMTPVDHVERERCAN
jgi:hypothetical protein